MNLKLKTSRLVNHLWIVTKNGVKNEKKMVGKSSYPINQVKIAFERFLSKKKKNPVEAESLINYRKSTDDCCFLLAKSDFSVSLIPCHNLHPVSLSLSLFLSPPRSLPLSTCVYRRVCMRVCLRVCVCLHARLSVCMREGDRQSIPFCRAGPLLIGDILPSLAWLPELRR